MKRAFWSIYHLRFTYLSVFFIDYLLFTWTIDNN